MRLCQTCYDDMIEGGSYKLSHTDVPLTVLLTDVESVKDYECQCRCHDHKEEEEEE